MHNQKNLSADCTMIFSRIPTIVKLLFLLLLVLLSLTDSAGAQIIGQAHWDLRSTVELESAYRTAAAKFQKSEVIITPELNVSLPFDIRLRGIGRLRADPFDELDPGQPAQYELAMLNKRTYLGDNTEFELRELFIDLFVGPAFLKVGKQQIVWGKTDGLKLLDVVNPQNFREFVLDDFEDSRIPLWSLMAEIPLGKLTAQVIWIPDRTYHKLPAPGADFRFRVPEFSLNVSDGFATTIQPIERPNDFFGDSDLGLRLSTFWKGWDLTLNYLYHYYDIPVVTRFIETTPTRRIIVDQHYRRSHLTGLTFSNAFGDFTLRGESALSFNRYFRTPDLTDHDGVKRAATLDYALGLDWFGLDDMLVSTQLFQNWILRESVTPLYRERVDTRMSLLIERTFMNERLEVELLMLVGLNETDGFIRPKVVYEWKSNLNIWAGVDGFWGDHKDLIGQFNRQDRVLLGLEIGL